MTIWTKINLSMAVVLCLATYGIADADLSIYSLQPKAAVPVVHHRAVVRTPIHRVSRPTPIAMYDAVTVSQAPSSTYKTIASGLVHLRTGGVLTVEPGIYSESLKLTRPITIEADPKSPPNTVLIESSSGPSITFDSITGKI